MNTDTNYSYPKVRAMTNEVKMTFLDYATTHDFPITAKLKDRFARCTQTESDWKKALADLKESDIF